MIFGRSCTRFAKKKECELLDSTVAGACAHPWKRELGVGLVGGERNKFSYTKNAQSGMQMITHELVGKMLSGLGTSTCGGERQRTTRTWGKMDFVGGTDLPGLGTVAACPFIGAGVLARNRRGGVFRYGGGGASCYGGQFALTLMVLPVRS
jgi:hypothetical protein